MTSAQQLKSTAAHLIQQFRRPREPLGVQLASPRARPCQTGSKLPDCGLENECKRIGGGEAVACDEPGAEAVPKRGGAESRDG